LLEKCRSKKAKRVFLYLADKLKLPFFNQLDLSKISLGTGKRQIVKGGEHNQKYQITVDREHKENPLRGIKDIEQLKVKRYSENTINTYVSVFSRFLEFYSQYKPEDISDKQIRKYMLYLVERANVSAIYQRQAINAIKFYYEKTLGRKINSTAVQRPKKAKKLPEVFSEEEVAAILKQVKNLKHKCSIVCYLFRWLKEV